MQVGQFAAVREADVEEDEENVFVFELDNVFVFELDEDENGELLPGPQVGQLADDRELLDERVFVLAVDEDGV